MALDRVEPLLWERFFERRPPDAVWLERIAVSIAVLGYKIESFIAAYAGSDERPDPAAWLWWQRDPADAGPAGPSPEEQAVIEAAWGDSYDEMSRADAG